MLGGEPQNVWANHTQHRAVPGASELGLHFAERVYQTHAFVLGSTEAATFLLCKHRSRNA